jgi:uncharacterized membrane protein YsdA (DUF1294 family)
MTNLHWLILGWLWLSQLLTFSLFGWDKWRAKRQKPRVSEFQLCLWSALGGWPAGLMGMLLFRHKTAKPSFIAKFIVALLIWLGLAWLTWHRLWPGPRSA